MNTQTIRVVLDEELATLLPDSIDLWSTIVSKWNLRQHQQIKSQILYRSLALAILGLMVVFVLSPQLRVKALTAFSQLASITRHPDQPLIFTPSPPFTVWQPGDLNDLELVQVAYSPGLIASTTDQVRVETNEYILLNGKYAPDKTNTLLNEIDKTWNVNQAAILLIYHAKDSDEIWIYERAASPDENPSSGKEVTFNNHTASLEISEQQLTLSWIANDTLIVLRSTPDKYEMILQLAESFSVTSIPIDYDASIASDAGVTSVTEVKQNTPGPNASIWSDQPMLVTNVSGQQYHGRLVLEVWTQGETLFFSSDENGNMPNTEFLERIIVSLGDSEVNILADTPWTNEPVLGEVPDEIFLGRVVVEVWDEHIALAITGDTLASILAQRSITRLEQIQRGLERNPP